MEDIDKKVTRSVSRPDGQHGGYMVFCPACQHGHLFDERWTFNGNFEKPTFSPSMLVNGSTPPTTKIENKYLHRCHSFVRYGQIQFLDDCTHDMKNKTVPLEPF